MHGLEKRVGEDFGDTSTYDFYLLATDAGHAEARCLVTRSGFEFSSELVFSLVHPFLGLSATHYAAARCTADSPGQERHP